MKYVERARGCQPGWLRKVDSIRDALMPHRCLVCGLAAATISLCGGCRAGLPACEQACLRCGLPLAAPQAAACGLCQRIPPAFDSVIAAMWYEFPVRQLIRQHKFHRNLAAGGVLAELLADRLAEAGIEAPAILAPVPLHGWRLFRRGFNQAHDIARQLSRLLALPAPSAALRRTRHTRQQAGLEQSARRSNLKHAFAWSGAPLAGRHVALVDDVMTTGSTVAECASTLRRAGAGRVDVWVVARAARTAHARG